MTTSLPLDIKYRPHTYDEVLGQEGTIKVLRRWVAQGKGFTKSYIFGGPWGLGKTTLGRILARTLLCEEVTPEGDPCGKCSSCVSMLHGSSEAFTEVDAATKSGKAHIARILEELDQATFTGKPRIYLFDESHQLSKDALDALLKPMEEMSLGRRRLICIFCTTEPEKMRATIGSRSLWFTVRPPSTEDVRQRLSFICEQEGISYEPEALDIIWHEHHGHLRDTISTLSVLGVLGGVTVEEVRRRYGHDLVTVYLDLLASVGSSTKVLTRGVEQLEQRQDPLTSCKRLAEVAVYCFQLSQGVNKLPGYLQAHRDRMAHLGRERGIILLEIARSLSSRLRNVTYDVLFCDLRLGFSSVASRLTEMPVGGLQTDLPKPPPAVKPSVEVKCVPTEPSRAAGDESSSELSGYITNDGVYVDPSRMKQNAAVSPVVKEKEERPDPLRAKLAEVKEGLTNVSEDLTPEAFATLLGKILIELRP